LINNKGSDWLKERCKLIVKNKKPKKCYMKITKKGKIKLIIDNKVKVIGEETILQSNIDAGKSCSIKCTCKQDRAFLMSDSEKKYKYYYCLSCDRIYKK